MKAGSLKRLGAAAALLVCFVVLPGQATAVDPPPNPPEITINDASSAEGDTITFKVTLSAADPDKPITVKASTSSDGTASDGDYTARTDVEITFAPNDVEEDFTVATVEDELVEGDETFSAILSAPSAKAVLAADHTGTGTITNDDSFPVVSISGAPPVAEGAAAVFTVNLSRPYPEEVTVNFATQNGTASEPGDYTAASGTITFAPNETAKSVSVATVNDTLDEDPETFTVNLSNPTKATLGASSATGTIEDDDNLPSVTINDVTVVEGHAGTVPAVFTVTLSTPSGREVRVPWATAPGTATEPEDYAPGNGTVVIPAGTTTGTITVAVNGDTLFEPNEQFSVVLVSPINATLADKNRGQGTITNDDTAPNPTVAPASIDEGNTGTRDLVFTVSYPARARDVTFNYRTVEGSATASGDQPDYQVAGGAITFPVSTTATSATISVKVNGDTLDENDESFTLELVRPADGSVAARASGTITNDDNNSSLSISDGSVAEPSTGSATLKLNVTLTPASARAVRVNWGTANGTASADSDYTASTGTLDFAPGQTSKEITIPVAGDAINEENETILVNLTGATGAGVADAQGVGTIIDKNAPPSLSIDDVLTREGETVTFTITLAGNTLRTVTVVAKTIEGTAKEGTDYHARRSVLTFAPGEKSKTFQVPSIDDAASEPIETFFVGLEDVTNATISKARGTATVDASDQVAKDTNPPLPPPNNPPPPKPKTLFPKMLLGPRSVTVNAGVAQMLVTCAKSSPLVCSGSVSFERVAKPKLVFGTKKFTVKPGKKGYVRITLTAQALRLLAQRRTMPARAVVVVRTSAKNLTVTPGVITLKQGKPVPTSKAPSTKVVVQP